MLQNPNKEKNRESEHINIIMLLPRLNMAIPRPAFDNIVTEFSMI